MEGPIGLPQPDLLPPQIPPRNPTSQNVAKNPPKIQSLKHPTTPEFHPSSRIGRSSTNNLVTNNHSSNMPISNQNVPLPIQINPYLPPVNSNPSNHSITDNQFMPTSQPGPPYYPHPTNYNVSSNQSFIYDHSKQVPNHLQDTSNHPFSINTSLPSYHPLPVHQSLQANQSSIQSTPTSYLANQTQPSINYQHYRHMQPNFSHESNWVNFAPNHLENSQIYPEPIVQPIIAPAKPAKSFRSLESLDSLSRDTDRGRRLRDSERAQERERGRERDLMHLEGPYTEAAVSQHLQQRWRENKFQVLFLFFLDIIVNQFEFNIFLLFIFLQLLWEAARKNLFLVVRPRENI